MLQGKNTLGYRHINTFVCRIYLTSCCLRFISWRKEKTIDSRSYEFILNVFFWPLLLIGDNMQSVLHTIHFICFSSYSELNLIENNSSSDSMSPFHYYFCRKIATNPNEIVAINTPYRVTYSCWDDQKSYTHNIHCVVVVLETDFSMISLILFCYVIWYIILLSSSRRRKVMWVAVMIFTHGRVKDI